MTIIFALGSVAQATTYRWVDAQGVVHYSDKPQPGAEKVDLPAAQTYQSPPPKVALPVAAPTEVPPLAVTAPISHDCAITAPTAEQTIINQPAVIVTATGPAGSIAKLLYDGGIAQKSQTGEFRIQPIARGSHTISVVFTTPGGGQLCRTKPVTFYVRQPSILNTAPKQH